MNEKRGVIKINRLYLAGKCGAPSGNCKNAICLKNGACGLIHYLPKIEIKK